MIFAIIAQSELVGRWAHELIQGFVFACGLFDAIYLKENISFTIYKCYVLFFAYLWCEIGFEYILFACFAFLPKLDIFVFVGQAYISNYKFLAISASMGY